MTKLQSRQRYLSYLLRLWQTDDGGKQIWRASLQSPGSEECRGFGSLEDLYEFLNAQVAQDEEGEGSL